MKKITKTMMILINIVLIITIFVSNVLCLLVDNGSFKSLVIAQTIVILGLNIITYVLCIKNR